MAPAGYFGDDYGWATTTTTAPTRTAPTNDTSSPRNEGEWVEEWVTVSVSNQQDSFNKECKDSEPEKKQEKLNTKDVPSLSHLKTLKLMGKLPKPFNLMNRWMAKTQRLH